MNLYYLLLVRIILCFNFGQSVFAGTWTSHSSTEPLNFRQFKVYTPTSISKKDKPALVVMLHGCEQSAEEFAQGTRIAEWAEKEKFIVLMPQQNAAYNPFKCWNWVLPSNNQRFGEPRSIVAMVDSVIESHNIDSEKVFAAGMSAGASMVSILGNCFPERFKALGTHDGTQYMATATGFDFASVVLSGASVPSSVAALAGHKCSLPAKNRPAVMPIIIIHGMNGPLMSPLHAFQVEEEMKAFNDYLDNSQTDLSYFKSNKVTKVAETKTYGYTLYTTTNADNDIFIERYMIDKLGHNWSGGTKGMKYNDPLGPDATRLMLTFFKKFGL